MPELLASALATPGIGWLGLAIFVAGVVRGFAGFGTALIFLPVAALFLPPIWAIITMFILDMFGTLPMLPRAARDGVPTDVAALSLGCLIFVPVGTMLLEQVDPDFFRWAVALLALGLVVLLASGWRHNISFGSRSLVGIGGASGLLGGLTGLPGPPVILAYMSGQSEPARIRGNTILYLFVCEIILAGTFLVRGLMVAEAVMIGLVLIPSYTIGNLIGARIFHPNRARLYRYVAYGLIAGAALLSLPLFG